MDLSEEAVFKPVKLNIVSRTVQGTRDNQAIDDILVAFMAALAGVSLRDLPTYCFRSAAFISVPTTAVIVSVPQELKAYAIDNLPPFSAHCETNNNTYTIRVENYDTNGYLSSLFALASGVAQGCPISPLLFLFATEAQAQQPTAQAPPSPPCGGGARRRRYFFRGGGLRNRARSPPSQRN